MSAGRVARFRKFWLGGERQMRWQRTIEVMDELARWWQSPNGEEFSATEENRNFPAAKYEARSLLGARAYWISSEMIELATHAAHSMPTQPVMPSDLPCPNGFALFEHPVIAPNFGKPVAFGAFCWKHLTLQSAVTWSFYADPFDSRDEYIGPTYRSCPPEASFVLPPLTRIGVHTWPYGKPEPLAENRVAENRGGSVEEWNQTIFWMRAVPRALWALMQQKLVTTTEQKPERAQRRRIAREGSEIRTDAVRCVTLRRLREGDSHEDGAPVNFSHRWIVSGFWRNQWHPSLKIHRVKWIAPYIKGPADKPLVVKRTVHNLVR